jgi:hypothetical protein
MLPSNGGVCTVVHMHFVCLCWQYCSEIEVCKVEECLYVIIAVLHSRNVWECHVELHQALGDHTLLYATSAG